MGSCRVGVVARWAGIIAVALVTASVGMDAWSILIDGRITHGVVGAGLTVAGLSAALFRGYG
jgi:hypothetical protein